MIKVLKGKDSIKNSHPIVVLGNIKEVDTVCFHVRDPIIDLRKIRIVRNANDILNVVIV